MAQESQITSVNKLVYGQFKLISFSEHRDFFLFETELNERKVWFVAVDTNPSPDIPEHQVVEMAALLYLNEITDTLAAVYVFRNATDELPAPFEIIRNFSECNFEKVIFELHQTIVPLMTDELNRSPKLGVKIG